MLAKIDGGKLRQLRTRKGWTLEALAARSGVSQRAIQDIENGVTLHPRPNTILWISKTLEVDPETLWVDASAPPAAPETPWAFVTVRDQEGNRLTRAPVSRERIQIGRDAANDVVLLDPRVSLFHALVIFRAGSLELRDLASANGTYVRGVPVREPQAIQLGEPITIASFVIEVRSPDEVPRPAAATLRIAR